MHLLPGAWPPPCSALTSTAHRPLPPAGRPGRAGSIPEPHATGSRTRPGTAPPGCQRASRGPGWSRACRRRRSRSGGSGRGRARVHQVHPGLWLVNARSCLRAPRASLSVSLARQGSITSLSNARKSMLAGVDIGWWCGYGFSRSRDQQGPAETNWRAAVHAVAVRRTVRWWSFEARAVQDGDGADGRTGWPAVIRGRREQ